MRGIFIDASDALAELFASIRRPGDPPVDVRDHDHVPAEALPALLDGYDFVVNDHTQMPTAVSP